VKAKGTIAMSFLLTLMVVQGFGGLSEEPRYAQLISTAIAIMLISVVAIMLLALLARMIRGWREDVRYATRSRADIVIAEDVREWHRRLACLAAASDDGIPEEMTARLKLARLVALRRDAERSGLDPHDRRERIAACEANLASVDEWSAEELRLQLLSLGPYDEYLMEVWRLEAEVLSEASSSRHVGTAPVEATIPQAPLRLVS